MIPSTAAIASLILATTLVGCSTGPRAANGNHMDLVFQKNVAPSLRFEVRTRATPEDAAIRPTTSPYWATGRLQVEYRLIDEADGDVVMKASGIHRVPSSWGLRVLDACVHEDRFFVLEKMNIGNALVSGQFDTETGVGRLRSRQSVLTESEALGPILVDGQIVECTEMEVRLNLRLAGSEGIERRVTVEVAK